MPLEKIVAIESTAVPVPGDDIDTDRIIPARFMRCVTFDGLGKYAFYDVRFDKDGKSRNHPLDDPRFVGAAILVSGRNFGCGSSREHAPQALRKYGIRAVIAESFAEIFAGNCTTLGMPCVQLAAAPLRALTAAITAQPGATVRIDLAGQTVYWPKEQAPFEMKPGAREALVNGEWDPLALLLDGREQVAALAAKLGYVRV
jgi:3-isopropylmalate/(R)-2-methylmalate dehydratase small subunit